ncbi:ribonuclease III [candidate division KSB1 bacterium]|nr:ribonuclease III [candidate division KSB1 bacterium]MBL7093288.1 ribonuclease III [candidate division KSB1 bacterium]
MKNIFANFLNNIFKRQEKIVSLSEIEIAKIEAKLNYNFNNKDFLIHALKHRSFLSVTNESRLLSNERLELLGDAVLGMVVVEYLFKKFPTKEEGDLTAIKSLLVSRKILARAARQIKLGNFILLNEAEEKAGGRNRSSILSDAYEAIIGAIYLDGSLQTAVDFINEKLLSRINEIVSEDRNKNFKSILLEYSQGNSLGAPRYKVKREDGPDHEKLFTIEVLIKDEVLGTGKGNSKKKAEQIAANNALKKINIL